MMRHDLHRRLAIVATTLAGLGPVACVAVPPPAPQAPAGPARESTEVEPDATAAALIAAHNRERARAGKPPLTFSPKLQAAAMAQARDMAEHGKMAHEGSNGSTPTERIKRAGYHFQRIGENVAAGQDTTDEVVKGWMDSPPHKKNILGDFNEMGGARAKSEDGTWYWCVDFGAPIPQLDPARAAAELVEAINRERSEAGKKDLTAHPALESAASAQARSMARRSKLSTRGPSGEDPFKAAEKAGYRFAKASEEVASGVPTPDEVVKGWIEEKAHKANLLGNFTQIGVGYATAEDGTPYWCVLFATPRKE